jgi:molybdate transport system regulatory protein
MPGCDGVFGGGKWRLLAAVEQEGSLRQAALALGRSYRKAWGDIRRSEAALGCSLVESTRGGTRGGATTLTPFGRELLTAWDRYQAFMEQHMAAGYRSFLAPVLQRTVAQSKLVE